MGRAKDKLIQLHEHVPQRALEGLNRLTGLRFRHWPESLAPTAVPLAEREPKPSLVEGNQALPA
ncbi:hypothetical protein E8F11_06010 [Pseudomonas sp. BN417]|uniref:hypothetical protein n=1 Tax=Pseudomonas sp. BN417 TaxID=2567890 RepID=UPI0024567780|nr:hypothetical protein [Pseudomonas sp. BN417]MDH4554733.1 hypothetical protein [Pseudomonas sp. BN417]